MSMNERRHQMRYLMLSGVSEPISAALIIPNERTPRNGGEGGIRTHGTVSRTLAFEASTFNRSVTSPRLFVIVTDGLLFQQCALVSQR
jgi:hypothetical protein